MPRASSPTWRTARSSSALTAEAAFKTECKPEGRGETCRGLFVSPRGVEVRPPTFAFAPPSIYKFQHGDKVFHLARAHAPRASRRACRALRVRHLPRRVCRAAGNQTDDRRAKRLDAEGRRQ